MTMRKIHTGMMAASLLSMLSLSTLAQAEAVQIDSGKMTFEHKNNQAEFTENVYLVRDDFELWCDRLVAYFKENKLERADAFGHVKLKQKEIHGSSERAELDQIKGTLTLIGHATLEQNGSRIEGDTVIYDTRNERTLVKPVAGGRTHMTFETDDKSIDLPGTDHPDASKMKENRQP